MKHILAVLLLAFATPALSQEIAIDQIPPTLLAQHMAPEQCEAPEDLPDNPPYAYNVGDGRMLYLLPCYGGSYRQYYVVYIGEKDDYRRVLFAVPTDTRGWQANDGVWLDHFDPATMRLYSFDLGNSVGSCGANGSWAWHEGSFVMLDYHLKADCSFDSPGEPGKFPLVYKNEHLPEGLLP